VKVNDRNLIFVFIIGVCLAVLYISFGVSINRYFNDTAIEIVCEEPEKARSMLAIARFFRNSPETYTNLGYAYEIAGEYPEAIRMYRASIRYNDRYLPAYVRLMSLFNKLGRYNDALELSVAALDNLDVENNTNHAQHYYSVLAEMAFGYTQKGSLSRGLTIANTALALEERLDNRGIEYTRREVLYFAMARILHISGDMERALSYYEQVISINPDTFLRSDVLQSIDIIHNVTGKR